MDFFRRYSNYTSTRLQQQRSVEMELSAILRGQQAMQGLVDGPGGDTDGEGGDADSCGSPDLDESLDSHFKYIQGVSTPQELASLLPRLQATLFELTDVALLKQQQAAAGAAGGGPVGVRDQLRLLSRLSFGRTVAAAFLLPLVDLCVRTKLNIIGRHLFLQEKFSKLRQPAAPAERLRLPPRLTAAAVEAFLGCEQLVERGAAWLVEQAMSSVDRVLGGMPMDTPVTPEELAGLVQAVAITLGQAVTAAGAASPTGSAWVDLLVGPGAAGSLLSGLGGVVGADAAAAAGSAEAYRRALASASMVEELETELRRVLGNYRFGEALHAAVGQCLGTCAAHIHATFISQAAAAVASPPPSSTSGEVATPAMQQAPSPRSRELPPQPPAQPHEQPLEQQPQQGVDDSGSDAATAGRQEPDAQAPQAAVAPEALGAPEAQPSPRRVVSPFTAAAAAATADDSEGEAGLEALPPLPAAAPSPRSAAERRASLAAAAVAAMQPRPLARCLRAVQGACEPLFADAREVSARIAALPPVMSLCAVAFAAPLDLQ
ncbi:hypothetical protein GPECTOR_11g122 [Gonium pectorale]|uniref:Uncharacterized protein n=1 Tax=Gonium pectorale TaxID=33097 RepID=A0A150GQP4_GONPE|nr:hypothetical protein GPECTOR_11g122 [Gonium pectorale]|eukprot:KXZ51670.1 hypothetical protein GPECTOR_11g122 [Gonium pectorale]